MAEDEVVDLTPVRATRGAIEKHAEPWAPSALATMEDGEFTRRLELARREVERVAQIQKHVMRDEIDYGKIPGTDKPTLLQPGAQILNRMAGLVPHYTDECVYGDGKTAPHIAYTVRCELRNRDGELVSEGFGSANTWEKKHRYRYNQRECPKCGAATIFRSKQGRAKWFCWANKGGCGAEFAAGTESAAIEAQPMMMENPDPFELANTVLKMACKRAYIAATVNAHACSGIFAQDVEPGDPDDDEQAAAQKTTAREAKKAPPKRQSKAKGEPAQQSMPADDDPISEQQMKMLWSTIQHAHNEAGVPFTDDAKAEAHDALLGELGVKSFTDIKRRDFSEAFAKVKTYKPEAAG